MYQCWWEISWYSCFFPVADMGSLGVMPTLSIFPAIPSFIPAISNPTNLRPMVAAASSDDPSVVVAMPSGAYSRPMLVLGPRPFNPAA